MSPFQKWLLIGSSAGTGVTGIVYAWMKYLLEPAEPWAVINHPWEPWVLKAHILVAPVMVFAVGLITVEHIWKHYRTRVRARRRSGLTLMAVLVPMVVSGYLIQAVTSAGWLLALVVAHLVTGGAYLLGLGVHWVVGRRRRNGNGAAAGPPQWQASGAGPAGTEFAGRAPQWPRRTSPGSEATGSSATAGPPR